MERQKDTFVFKATCTGIEIKNPYLKIRKLDFPPVSNSADISHTIFAILPAISVNLHYATFGIHNRVSRASCPYLPVFAFSGVNGKAQLVCKTEWPVVCLFCKHKPVGVVELQAHEDRTDQQEDPQHRAQNGVEIGLAVEAELHVSSEQIGEAHYTLDEGARHSVCLFSIEKYFKLSVLQLTTTHMEKYLPKTLKPIASQVCASSPQGLILASLSFFQHWQDSLLERESQLRPPKTLPTSAPKCQQLDILTLLNSAMLKKEQDLRQRELQVVYREKLMAERQMRIEELEQEQYEYKINR